MEENMNRKIQLSVCILIMNGIGALNAEEQTLLSDTRCTGWYFASRTPLTVINEEVVPLDGIQAALIFDRKWILGMSSTDMEGKNDLPAPLEPNVENVTMKFDYHGLILGYISDSSRLVHWTGELHLAWGSVSYRNQPEGVHWDKDLVGVVEPSLHAEVNVFRWMKASAGIGYRAVFDTDLEGLSFGKISAPTALLTIKFGKFDR